MEQEARDILRAALDGDAAPNRNLGTAIHELFRPFGGVELEIPPREPMREPPRFNFFQGRCTKDEYVLTYHAS